MIKRHYFFYAKVAHNNNTGKYSWHYNFVTYRSWFPAPVKALAKAMDETSCELEYFVPNLIDATGIEIITFNKV